ncbi:hypothetical protein ACFQ7F_44475 [Streptomyces sp. NPDC056486]|uniref:hypothetical protein n=1 Tax=Streptomyces sp. NPDC056486 TaxID=3345835 RepID=UPI0036AC057B
MRRDRHSKLQQVGDLRFPSCRHPTQALTRRIGESAAAQHTTDRKTGSSDKGKPDLLHVTGGRAATAHP